MPHYDNPHDFDQSQAEALERLRASGSFILFTFDEDGSGVNVKTGISSRHVPMALSALETAYDRLASLAVREILDEILDALRDDDDDDSDPTAI